MYIYQLTFITPLLSSLQEMLKLSEELKQQGNTLFKAGDIEQAIVSRYTPLPTYPAF